MVQKLRPLIELNSDRWAGLLAKYRLESVVSTAHMQMLWCRMQKVLDTAIWYEIPSDNPSADVWVAATLGMGVDQLIFEWSDKGQILDSYAAECLAMEALQCTYQLLEDRLAEEGFYITKYCFPEPTEDGCRQMLEILRKLRCGTQLQLMDEGMLRPMKSVVFRGVLTRDRQQRCGTICASCGRMDCPNRHSLHMGNYREPGALKYSYGYQRIFGRS